MSDLLVVNVEEIVPIDFFTGNGVQTLIAASKPRIEAFKADATTKEGAAEIRAAVKEIIAVRDFFDTMKVTANRELKEKPKLVDKNGKILKDTLNEWKVKIRADLTAIEQVEKDAALADEMKLQEAEAKRIAGLEAREAEMKAKEEEYARKEREEQIRKESAELAKREAAEALKASENARIAAEAKAKADAEQARKDAEFKQKYAETQAKEAAERAERDKEAAIQKVKDDAAKAEGERLANEARAEREAKMIQDRANAEEAARQANKEHQRKINNEVLEDLLLVGILNIDAKDIVTRIAKGDIRHVSINY